MCVQDDLLIGTLKVWITQGKDRRVSWFFFIFLQDFYSHSVSLDSLSLSYHCKHFSFGQNGLWIADKSGVKESFFVIILVNLDVWWPRSFRIWMLLFLCVILVTRSDARTFARVKVPIFSATSFFWLALSSGLEWKNIRLRSPGLEKTFAFIWCGILQDGVNWGPSGTLVWLKPTRSWGWTNYTRGQDVARWINM